MSRSEKIQLYVWYFVNFILIISLAVSVWTQQWFTAFLSFLTIVLCYVPSILARSFKVVLPLEFELIVTFFMYASIFLGSVWGYYEYFWWWDVFLHTMSGMVLGMVGFLIVFILHSEEKFKLRLTPLYIAVFSFSFSLALGALWEIFEFFLDLFFDMQMQHGSLVDTMSDLIVDAIGAFVVAVSGALYIRNASFALFTKLIEKFIEKNPLIFKKRKKSAKKT